MNNHFSAVETKVCNERELLCSELRELRLLAEAIGELESDTHTILDALEDWASDSKQGNGDYSIAQLDRCTFFLVSRVTGFVVLQVKGVR